MSSSISNYAPLALTMGEPSGIGPEITIKSWLALKERRDIIPFFTINDGELLKRRAADLGLDIEIELISSAQDSLSVFSRKLPVLEEKLPRLPVAGKIDEICAKTVVSSIERAVSLVKAKKASAIVTNPIHKSCLDKSNFKHIGHSEFLTFLDGAKEYLMVLAAGNFRVGLVTAHIPLTEVSAKITHRGIINKCELAVSGLRKYFAIKAARIAVIGLNPHAGEDGLLGREEIEVIMPAIEELKSLGYNVYGVFSGDSFFHTEYKNYDLILCMYHDQGLIALKSKSFTESVNMTFGLSFIRVSVGHGTALKIASKGIASCASLNACFSCATSMVLNDAD